METKTVLCVDDEAHILQVVSLKLQNAGFNVITAKDAEEALECAHGIMVDLVITDFQMPGMSGLDLAKRMHKDPGRRDMPIILLTAHGLALEQVELNHAGISTVISKPFSPREILLKANELMADSQNVSKNT